MTAGGSAQDPTAASDLLLLSRGAAQNGSPLAGAALSSRCTSAASVTSPPATAHTDSDKSSHGSLSPHSTDSGSLRPLTVSSPPSLAAFTQHPAAHGTQPPLSLSIGGIPASGVRTRTETQVRLLLRMQPVPAAAGSKPVVLLPAHLMASPAAGLVPHPDDVPRGALHLTAKVLRVPDGRPGVPCVQSLACSACVVRERKRMLRRRSTKSDLHDACGSPALNRRLSAVSLRQESPDATAVDRERIIVFAGSSRLARIIQGEILLPIRLTCYSRHHDDRTGFRVQLELWGADGRELLGVTLSPPIYVTDDHKRVAAAAARAMVAMPAESPNGAHSPHCSSAESVHHSSPELVQYASPPLPFVQAPAFSSVSSPPTGAYGPVETAALIAQRPEFASMLRRGSVDAAFNMSPPSLFAASPQPHARPDAYSPPPDARQALLAPPTVVRVCPAEGPLHGGIEVSVLGDGFMPGVVVLFGGTPAPAVHFVNASSLLVRVPPAATAGTVYVSAAIPHAGIAQRTAPTVVFRYKNDLDAAMMEVALQLIGMKLTGRVEDARDVAMRIISEFAPGAPSDSGAQSKRYAPAGYRHYACDSDASLSDGESSIVSSCDCPCDPLMTEVVAALNASLLVDEEEREAALVAVLGLCGAGPEEILAVRTHEGQTLAHLAALARWDDLLACLVAIVGDSLYGVMDAAGYTVRDMLETRAPSPESVSTGCLAPPASPFSVSSLQSVLKSPMPSHRKAPLRSRIREASRAPLLCVPLLVVAAAFLFF